MAKTWQLMHSMNVGHDIEVVIMVAVVVAMAGGVGCVFEF